MRIFPHKYINNNKGGFADKERVTYTRLYVGLHTNSCLFSHTNVRKKSVNFRGLNRN